MRKTSDDLCSRCMQPVPRDARRCPGCGLPHSDNRRVTLVVAAVLVLLLALAAVVVVLATRSKDIEQPPTQRAFVLVRATV